MGLLDTLFGGASTNSKGPQGMSGGGGQNVTGIGNSALLGAPIGAGAGWGAQQSTSTLRAASEEDLMRFAADTPAMQPTLEELADLWLAAFGPGWVAGKTLGLSTPLPLLTTTKSRPSDLPYWAVAAERMLESGLLERFSLPLHDGALYRLRKVRQ